MKINQLLNDDCLTLIMCWLPVTDLHRLTANPVCHRWIEPLKRARYCVTQLSIHGGPEMLYGGSLNSSLRLLQSAHQLYGMQLLPSSCHLTIQPYNNNVQLGQLFTMKTAERIVSQFPNITHLELVQLAMEKNLDQIGYLLTGSVEHHHDNVAITTKIKPLTKSWSQSLERLSIFHERTQEYVYWENIHLDNREQLKKKWAIKHIQQLEEWPFVLLYKYCHHDQLPRLKSLTLFDQTIYNSMTILYHKLQKLLFFFFFQTLK